MSLSASTNSPDEVRQTGEIGLTTPDGNIVRRQPEKNSIGPMTSVRLETAASQPVDSLPPSLAAFRARAKDALRIHPIDPELWRSRWLTVAIEKAGGNPETLIAELVERVKRAPTHANVLAAQAMVNELGRQSDASETFLAAGLTKGTIREVIKLTHTVKE